MTKTNAKISTGKPNENLEDFGYIISEVNRIQNNFRENSKNALPKNRCDFLYSLPNPGGFGVTIIGQEAAHKFLEIAKRAHQIDSQLRDKTTASILNKTIQHVFQEEILGRRNKQAHAGFG